MTKREWIVSVLAGIILGVAAVIFGLAGWVLPQNAQASTSMDDILLVILNGHSKWTTIQGEAEVIWYGSERDIQRYVDRFEISQPGSARFEMTNSSKKVGQRLWISDGAQVFLDDRAQANATTGLPRFAQDLSVLPTSLSEIRPDVIYHHPFSLIIPSPVTEYIFPHWFAQGKPGAMYSLVGDDDILGRKVWIVEYSDSGYRTTSWIDQETGVILRHVREIEGHKKIEFNMLALTFDSFIDPSHFNIP